MNDPRREPQVVPTLLEAGQPSPCHAEPTSSSAERDPLAGTSYRAVRRLGLGGMGEVYEAVHVGLNKAVVVKLLHSAIAGDPRYADRLRIEAQILASVDSPYLVAVSDIGVTPGNRAFFVMDRLYGATLRQVLQQRGAVPPGEAIQWVIHALMGLAVAHRKGIVHRDVKLDNLFLCDPGPQHGPMVKVLDFGVAKVIEGAGLPFPGPKYATEAHALVGTPRYISPEQVRFEPVDARADVYATGVVLYTLLAGHGPFPHAANPLAILNAHLLEVPPPPSSAAPRPIPPELDHAVLKAMAKRPEARFQSAELFADELRRVSALLVDTTLPLPAFAPMSALPFRTDTAILPGSLPVRAGEFSLRPTLSGQTTLHAERPLATLPLNLVEIAAPTARSPPSPSSPLPSSPSSSSSTPERRTFVAIMLASAAFFFAFFLLALHWLGVL